MKRRQKLLTDEQWELIGPLFPEPRSYDSGVDWRATGLSEQHRASRVSLERSSVWLF